MVLLIFFGKKNITSTATKEQGTFLNVNFFLISSSFTTTNDHMLSLKCEEVHLQETSAEPEAVLPN